MNCYLCDSSSIELDETLDSDNVIADWNRVFHIDVAPDLAGHTTISLYRCRNCDLGFFSPPMAGGGQMYAQLQNLSWYYLARKWEHDVALQDVSGGEKVLEVGCGRGDFIARLEKEKAVEVTGLEMNPAAVREAQGKGRNVVNKGLEEIVSELRGTFDVICSFQVLEHVPNPREFIGNCVELLKPDGMLLLSVPNDDGFIRLGKNELLNKPPHHLSRWSERVFFKMQELFPVKLKSVLFEPLASYHLSWYADLQYGRLPYIPYLSGIGYRALHKLILPLALMTNVYTLLRGHSIYVCYRKTNGTELVR